jgi:Tfp pilus assembly protein PilO
MGTGAASRFWLIGGAAAAAVLLAAGWFLVIGPQYAQTSSLREQAVTTQLRMTSLQHRLAELRQENERLPQHRAQLTRDRQALPATSALSDFLRELHTAGDSKGVSVTGFVVGTPTQVVAAGTQVYALPITLTASGTAAKLSQFLDQLQQVQPRAVLISSVNAVPGDDGGSFAGAVTLTLNLRAFVDPASTAKTAQPSTGTN